MQLDWQSLGKSAESANLQLPLGRLQQRSDNIIKSCRTSHSELAPLEQQTGFPCLLTREESKREEHSYLEQYNIKLLSIIDALKSQVTRLTAEILEKDGRLKYHAERTVDTRRQLGELNLKLQNRDEEIFALKREQEASCGLVTSLREVNARLSSEIERLKRCSVDTKVHIPPIRINEPRITVHKDSRLALSDIKSDSKLRLPQPEIHEDDETNLFEISNYTESDTLKRDMVNHTPPKIDDPVSHLNRTPMSSSGSRSKDAQVQTLQRENRRLQNRIEEQNTALRTCQRLLGEMEQKSRVVQAYYEQSISKLKLRIQLMQHSK